MSEKILHDNCLPSEIEGSVDVTQAYFTLKKVENDKELKGVICLKIACKLLIGSVKIETKYIESKFAISQDELNELLPKFVQEAYLEDRVVGVIS